MAEQQTIENRVIALYRVSDKQQVDKNDIPMQRKRCNEYVQEQGWTLVDELYEKGISGFKVSAKDRDAIQELQRRAIQKEFDILLVFMFDRLGRRDDETPFIVEWFVQNGVQVWSAQEGQQRFDNHVDKLMNYIRFWQTSGESLKTSMRVKTKFEQMTREGIYHGGSAPYGYRLERKGRTNKKNQDLFDLVIDPNEADIVKTIFRKYVFEGYGSQRLANFFNEQGLKKRGNDFSNTAIQRILSNAIYSGVLISGGVQSGPFPDLQIIDPDLFEQVDKIRQGRTFRHADTPLSTKSKALLKGIIYCGECGARMNMSSGGHGALRYRCYNKARHPDRCNGLSACQVSKLDSIVVDILKSLFREIRSVSNLDLKQNQQQRFIQQKSLLLNDTNSLLTEKQKELDTLKAEVLNAIRGTSGFSTTLLNDMIEKSSAELAALSLKADALASSIADLKGEMKALDKQNQQFFSWADLFLTCSNEAKVMIIHQLISQVRVFSADRIEIDFTIAFDQFLKCCGKPVHSSFLTA